MTISVFDLFKVGIGPSSSHTVGPMKAARMFAEGLRDDGLLPRVAAVRVGLYGSLGLTGKGHGSDKAVLLGLEGDEPATVDVDAIPGRLAAITERRAIRLLGEHEIGFTVAEHLEFNRKDRLSYHPNGMRFTAYDETGAHLRQRAYYSVGGGFVTGERADGPLPAAAVLPYPFATAAQRLVAGCPSPASCSPTSRPWAVRPRRSRRDWAACGRSCRRVWSAAATPTVSCPAG